MISPPVTLAPVASSVESGAPIVNAAERLFISSSTATSNAKTSRYFAILPVTVNLTVDALEWDFVAPRKSLIALTQIYFLLYHLFNFFEMSSVGISEFNTK